MHRGGGGGEEREEGERDVGSVSSISWNPQGVHVWGGGATQSDGLSRASEKRLRKDDSTFSLSPLFILSFLLSEAEQLMHTFAIFFPPLKKTFIFRDQLWTSGSLETSKT